MTETGTRSISRLGIAAVVLVAGSAGCAHRPATYPPAPTRAELEARAGASSDSAAALRDLAWAQSFDGDRDAARAGFARALALDGADARALLGAAALAEEDGRYAEALDLFARVLESAPRAVAPDPFRPAVELVAASALERLAGEAPGQAALERRLGALDARTLDVDAASRLLAARATFARRRGGEDEARALEAARGCPAEVLTAGPYGHLPRLDLARPFGPDHDAPAAATGDEDRVVQRAPVRACGFHVQTPQGRPGVAYAIAWVKAPRALDVTVGVASDQPWALLVDGVVVERAASEDHFPARTRTLELPLRAGWHRFALKLAAPGPRTSAGLRFSAPEPLETAAEPPPGTRPGRAPRPADVRVHRGALVPDEAAAASPLLATYLAALAAARDGDSEAGHAAAERLRAGAPKFVPGLVLSAYIAAADPSRPQRIARDRARRHLARALALDPRCVAARYELAQLDVGDDKPDKALALLAEAPDPVAPPDAERANVVGGAVSSAGDRAPQAPWRLSFARFLALRARTWNAEAERALVSARATNPEACQPIDGELRVALDRRDYTRARRVAAELSRCQPDAEDLARVLREIGDLAGAAAELGRLLALDPTRQHVRASLGEVLIAKGDAPAAVAVLRDLVARDPLVASYRRQLADALIATADAAGARAVLVAGMQRSPEAQELHRALAALDQPGPIDPFRLDGRKVIAEFEASGARYDAPAVIVLDRTVTRVFSTGARLTVTHNIIRVQTKDGIDKFGEVQVPEGADVLVLRTVKADGTTREPEEIAEKQSVSVPDLQPGDYVEFEYIDPAGAPQAFPGGFYGERFYFQSFDAPLDRTEFVLVTPRGMEVQIDTRGAVPKPVQVERDGDDVRSWSDRAKAQLLPEPQQTPFTEYVPSVRVGSGVSLARWRDFLLDQQFGSRRANAELRALAAELRTPRAIDRWVRRRIKQGGGLDDAATAILARGEGSRIVLARALLAAAGFSSEVWLARARTDANLDGSPLPNLEGYDEGLLAVEEAPGRRLVLDPRFRHAPSGFVAPPLRGQPAIVINAPGAKAKDAAVRLERVPGSVGDAGAPAADDERRVRLTATLRKDGGADVRVEETLVGWPALDWREALDRINEDRVRAEFEQRTLGFFFPGATLSELSYEPRDDDEAPLVVRYAFTTPSLARLEGNELQLAAPYPALLGKRYVGVAERATPLQLLYAPPTTLAADIRLPAGARVNAGTAGGEVRAAGFGTFTQSVRVVDEEDGGAVLQLRGTFHMAPIRVAASDYASFRKFAETIDIAEARAATIALP